ncbi:hypothetical protein CSB09_02620 [Candidatus Gracilibacteria bacterium]|nr:MAG: hypothetical protein CSB09_02620 [Candidatus Gracilibacteria bacterium]
MTQKNNPSVEETIQTVETLKQNNKHKQALDTVLVGLKQHTDDYRLYEELADIYLYQGNIEKAEEVIGYARELHPESGTGIFLEGYIAVEKGDFDGAIKILSKANLQFPNNPEILRNLGWSYVMKGSVDKGIILLRRALALDPDHPITIQNLSNALLSVDQ